jgi:hypothetical protein
MCISRGLTRRPSKSLRRIFLNFFFETLHKRFLFPFSSFPFSFERGLALALANFWPLVDLDRWVAVPRFARRVDVAPLSSRAVGVGAMGKREVRLPRRVWLGRVLGWRGCERVFVLREGWGRVFSGF